MPSINEGFPLVIVEAMLASIPVVASTVGGIPEIVVPDSTGLLVPPGDPDALAQALRRLADDPQLRRDMGARCRSVALEQFTDKAMAARFEALYREVLAARTPTGLRGRICARQGRRVSTLSTSTSNFRAKNRPGSMSSSSIVEAEDVGVSVGGTETDLVEVAVVHA